MEPRKNSKAWIIIIILIIVGVYIHESFWAKKAQDYYSACTNLYIDTNTRVGSNLDYRQCNCVSNLYYNNQLIRKLGFLENLPTCN